jgi:hypothetical protein
MRQSRQPIKATLGNYLPPEMPGSGTADAPIFPTLHVHLRLSNDNVAADTQADEVQVDPSIRRLLATFGNWCNFEAFITTEIEAGLTQPEVPFDAVVEVLRKKIVDDTVTTSDYGRKAQRNQQNGSHAPSDFGDYGVTTG